MSPPRLSSNARLAIALQTLYFLAESFCSVFVAVYLWVNSHDFGVVCKHYLALYSITPVVFIFAGWYAQARDRLHVYRLGLVLHIVYYAVILYLQERSADYALELGAILGVTWGIYWPGANTFNYDATVEGSRELFFGTLQAFVGSVRFLAPVFAGIIIHFSADELAGYNWIFALVIVVYILCFVLSFWMPHDREYRPFHIRRALFPGKDQREWRIVMVTASTLAGAYYIFQFFLGLLMYMETENELTVGGYTSVQAIVTVIVSSILARVIVPSKRLAYIRWGCMLLVAAGVIISFKITVATLFLFGIIRSVAGPMFATSHFGYRMDTIAATVRHPSERIEYLCAWETPLAIGRVVIMSLMWGLYELLDENELGLRLALLALCSLRILTYLVLRQSETLRTAAGLAPLANSR